MSEVPFGHGVLSQGEVILSREQDRLLAKRAWLYLYEYLMRNDERVKATRLAVPWSLEGDYQVIRSIIEAKNSLRRFQSPEDYIAFYERKLGRIDKKRFDSELKLVRQADRPRWIYDQVISENPLTVLDVGGGFGTIAIELGRSGINVTSIALLEREVEFAREVVKKEKLPVEFLIGVFETLDFKDLKFDVVVAGEVIEHVADDLAFLDRCVELSNKSVIVTTPHGSCEGGFIESANLESAENDAHVRAYSLNGFKALLARVRGGELSGKVVEKFSCNSTTGSQINCLCARIQKLKEVPDARSEKLAPQGATA